VKFSIDILILKIMFSIDIEVDVIEIFYESKIGLNITSEVNNLDMEKLAQLCLNILQYCEHAFEIVLDDVIGIS
jgi:hypothetical protein